MGVFWLRLHPLFPRLDHGRRRLFMIRQADILRFTGDDAPRDFSSVGLLTSARAINQRVV